MSIGKKTGRLGCNHFQLKPIPPRLSSSISPGQWSMVQSSTPSNLLNGWISIDPKVGSHFFLGWIQVRVVSQLDELLDLVQWKTKGSKCFIGPLGFLSVWILYFYTSEPCRLTAYLMWWVHPFLVAENVGWFYSQNMQAQPNTLDGNWRCAPPEMGRVTADVLRSVGLVMIW